MKFERFLQSLPKLFIPSTLYRMLLPWCTQMNVCALSKALEYKVSPNAFSQSQFEGPEFFSLFLKKNVGVFKNFFFSSVQKMLKYGLNHGFFIFSSL